METIETIISSYHQLSNAHIDWSPTAGMFWLTPTMIGFIALMAWGIPAADRRTRKRALYREAQAAAQDRLTRWERRGYLEVIQTL